MCEGLALSHSIVVVLADRHSTFAEEKAMTKGKEEKERTRERGRWSNYRRGTAMLSSLQLALLAPFALLPSDFTVRQSQNQSQTDESSLHSSHANSQTAKAFVPKGSYSTTFEGNTVL